MAKQPESKLQREMRRQLQKEVGGFWWKVHGGPYQLPGIPDLCGCVSGLYISIEVKTPDDKKGASETQKAVMKLIRRAGGLAFVSDDIEYSVRRVKKRVKKYGKVSKHQTLPSSETSSKVRVVKGRRVIHGAGDGEDTSRSVRRQPKVEKKRTKTRSRRRT